MCLMNDNLQVTWIEHSEYDDSGVHQIFRSYLSSGMGFGAQRWLATLQRQCECLATLLAPSIPNQDQIGYLRLCPFLKFVCPTIIFVF